MQTITKDTVDFLPLDDLQKLVNRAIDAQADSDNPDNPQRAAHQARDRRIIVEGAMIDLFAYPDDARAMLLGYWQHFGGNRK